MAQWLKCPPLTRKVVGSRLGRVIPSTIVKMVQTAPLLGTQGRGLAEQLDYVKAG